MKKNIDVITADSATMQHILDLMNTAPMESASFYDIQQGIKKLVSGSSSSILIESGLSAVSSGSANRICCGDLVIEISTRRVFMNGNPVVLTPKEFDILLLLARNQGEVFTKEQIYEAVWDKDYLLDGSNIMAFIRKLRKKIEPNPDSPEYILTVWGIGYKFADHL